jgi:subtilisin family serine protease
VKSVQTAIRVQVVGFNGELLRDATVVVRPAAGKGRGKQRGITLRFDPRNGAYTAALAPGDYIAQVTVRGYDAQERAVALGTAAGAETFVLGRKGMPFYYRGRVRVPFEPRADRIGVAFGPDTTDETVDAIRRALQLEEAETPEPAKREHVRVFRLPAPLDRPPGRELLLRVSKHPRVRRAGAIVRIDRGTVAFLTTEIVARFLAQVTQEQVAAIARQLRLTVHRNIPYAGNAYLLEAKGPADYAVLHACETLVQTGLVEYAEPNLVQTAVDDFTPNDDRYDEQPHHAIVQSETAWDGGLGDASVIVAVVDAGCDISHEDFQDAALPGGTNIYQAFDFTSMDADPTSNSHGTKSTGIVAAITNNTTGVAGMAGDCRLIAVRYPSGGTDLDHSDTYIWCAGFDPESTTAGFPAPISPGADVISSSFGISQAALSGLMRDTLDFLTTYPRNGKGCVVVFSVGNDDSDFTTYRQWAAYDKTIAVASSRISPPDAAEVKVSTSNYGAKVDVCAPGGGAAGGTETRTLSTTNTGTGPGGTNYDTFGQTSCACPQVSGTAALLLSVNPDLTWIEVRDILRRTAVRIDYANVDPIGQWVDLDGDTVAEFSQWYGYGRINTSAAVDEATGGGASRDLVVRDNLSDDGTVPSTGAFWDSPDLWVRTTDPAGDAGALPAAYGDAPPHQSPISGQANWVYVRLRNAGTDDSLPFYIRVYITHWAGAEFIYPSDFVPTNHPGDPIPSPLTPGTYLIGEVAHAGLAAGTVDIVNVEWPAALVPPQTVDVDRMEVEWHPCLLVEVAPHEGTASGNHVWDSSNRAQKNISIVYMDDDAEFATAAVIGHRLNRQATLILEIDRRRVPRNISLYVDLLGASEAKPADCALTILHDTRVAISCPSSDRGIVLELPKGTRLECGSRRHLPGVPIGRGVRRGFHHGRPVLWLDRPVVARMEVQTGPARPLPLIVGGVVHGQPPDMAVDVPILQLNPDGSRAGAFALRLTPRPRRRRARSRGRR